MKRSKRYKSIKDLVNKSKYYSLDEAIDLLKKLATTKFNESVEIHMKLGINPKHSDQIVRGTVLLPHGTGKQRRVAVIASGEKLKEAETSGADYFGAEELIDKISKGWCEFDILISTPDMMRHLGKLGKMLGPKGLMPNPKTGTVTFDIAKTVKEVKSGRIEFKNDNYGIIHNAIGKISFSKEQLIDNIKAYIEAITRAKPVAAKGEYIRSISICSSMGPAIRIDLKTI